MASVTTVWAYQCPVCYEEFQPDKAPIDGRCNLCEASPMLQAKQSEFGAGLVVCLVKFSEHLNDRHYQRIWDYVQWLKNPQGRSPQAFDEEWWYRDSGRNRGDNPQEYALHQTIHMWANAAADHFYDLDEDRAPVPLRELASLMMELRNDHLTDTPRLFTLADLDRVRELWRESCLALDEALGTKPNWGEW
jgi:hypothetical protein